MFFYNYKKRYKSMEIKKFLNLTVLALFKNFLIAISLHSKNQHMFSLKYFL